MNKIGKKPLTILAPVPVVLVSCTAPGYQDNITTIAWAGTVCSDPVMLSVSIRPARYSHEIISQSREFVVNLPNRNLYRATDYCGVVSGREVDKFAMTGLTASPAEMVKAPLITEAPVNIECRVTEIIHLGVHDLFLAEVIWIHCATEVLNDDGILDLKALGGIMYSNSSYYQVGEPLGKHGWSQKTPRD